jgi:anti-sigma regulatory factor (Ser/Thr protein kinase)
MTATVPLATVRRLPLSAAPRLARRGLEQVGELAHYPDLRFTAQLLASELVANTVRHAGLAADQALTLSVECDEETLRVEVVDVGPGFDALEFLAGRHRRGVHHRGILLVDALADRWGFCRGDGFRVWFEIDLVPGRRPCRGREPVPERHPDR